MGSSVASSPRGGLPTRAPRSPARARERSRPRLEGETESVDVSEIVAELSTNALPPTCPEPIQRRLLLEPRPLLRRKIRDISDNASGVPCRDHPGRYISRDH